MKNTVGTIVLERILNAPVEKVWSAITDNDELKAWYFDFGDFKAEIGFKFQFFTGDEKKFLQLCEVTEVVYLKKFGFSWRYDGYEGISYVIFELFSENEKTRLKLTHKGLDSFPSDIEMFAVDNFEQGWLYYYDQLKTYLESKN
jgi:uncharacterized protein YndB with AHSA1/START domain